MAKLVFEARVPLRKQALVVLYDLKKVAAENARFMFPALGTEEVVMSAAHIGLRGHRDDGGPL